MKLMCEVSLGEMVDKYTILTIKEKFISDEAKLVHIKKEKDVIFKIIEDLKLENLEPLLNELTQVNETLWKIEDDIREKEKAKEFDEKFIEIARSVYVTNDLRFELKNRINTTFGSGIQEVKSYEDYN
jgi:patatin-like phospholipase/acyl hydrolase